MQPTTQPRLDRFHDLDQGVGSLGLTARVHGTVFV
jgi:hypothetical protein